MVTAKSAQTANPGVYGSMHARVVAVVLALAATVYSSGAGQEVRPTQVAALHYPCLALRAKVEGYVQVRCTVSASGFCSDVVVLKGHPLFGETAIANAKKWRFPVVRPDSRPRTINLDYVFRIRGVRRAVDDDDVHVVVALPNRIEVTAPFDPNVPCRVRPMR